MTNEFRDKMGNEVSINTTLDNSIRYLAYTEMYRSDKINQGDNIDRNGERYIL